MWPTFLLSTWVPESLLGPKPGPLPSDAPSNAPFRSWERGRKEEERKSRGQWGNREGPLGTGGSKGSTASVCPVHLGPNKPTAVPVLILHTWRCEAAPCPPTLRALSRPLGPEPRPRPHQTWAPPNPYPHLSSSPTTAKAFSRVLGRFIFCHCASVLSCWCYFVSFLFLFFLIYLLFF